jgi:uncharacterized coiled-coil DUF342 family protein
MSGTYWRMYADIERLTDERDRAQNQLQQAHEAHEVLEAENAMLCASVQGLRNALDETRQYLALHQRVHRQYADGIAEVLKDVRPYRSSGEPLTSDRQVIALLKAVIAGYRAEIVDQQACLAATETAIPETPASPATPS